MCSEADELRAQARRCRRLAIGVDDRTNRALMLMAEDFDARARLIESNAVPQSLQVPRSGG